MSKKYLSIQEASDLSKKSIQTIRRAIKSKKLSSKRQKTPQGFNYLVEFESLCEIYNVKPVHEKEQPKAVSSKKIKAEVKNLAENTPGKFTVSSEDFKSFTITLEQMISQHSEERQNFLRLVNTLQEKIFVLENQLNLLQAPNKKWYQLWK